MIRAAGRCAVAAAVVALSFVSAAASPLELFGFGGRSPALAGAGVASSDGYDAVYLNPGGLGRVRHKRATVGVVYGDLELVRDGRAQATDPVAGLVLGGALPVPLGGAARDRVGLGFGFHVPTEAINRARAPFPGQPTFALLESRSHVVAIQVAVGVRLGPRWSVGAGVNALAVLRGGIAVTTDGAGRFTTVSEQRLLARYAPLVGARWTWRPDVELGLVARAPSRSDYDIAITTDLSAVVPVELPPIRIAGAAQYDPLTVALETAWRVRPDLTVTGHLAWARWSGFPLPTQNPVAGAPAQEAPGFHDTAIPRLAVEHARAAARGVLTARAGYAFLWSPAPEQRGRQSLLDNHRHLIAAGVGLAWPGRAWPFHVDAWAQLHALAPRRHTKDGARFLPGEELPFATASTRGRVLVAGVTLGVDL